MPKGGGNLGFRLLQVLAERAGYSQARLSDAVVDPRQPDNVLSDLGPDTLARACDELEDQRRRMCVLFTQAPPSSNLALAMAQGWAGALAVSRDPRDLALAMVDAGYASFRRPEDIRHRVARSLETYLDWAMLRETRRFAYEDLARNGARAAADLAEDLGLTPVNARLAAKCAHRRAEWDGASWGGADKPWRHLFEMTRTQSRAWEIRFAAFIRAHQATLRSRGALPPPALRLGARIARALRAS